MNRRKVSDIASDRPIVQLSPSATVREASRLMARERVGAVLITEGERLLGIFTERDALGRVLARQLDPEATQLDSVMTADPVTVSPAATAIEALRLMRDGGFRHLPVTVDDDLVGVVSLRDFVGAELAAVEDGYEAEASRAKG